jgi:hypothetical protein
MSLPVVVRRSGEHRGDYDRRSLGGRNHQDLAHAGSHDQHSGDGGSDILKMFGHLSNSLMVNIEIQ